MDPYSNDVLLSDRPVPSQQDSDDRPEAVQDRNLRKNKPIKKNVKGRPKQSDPASLSTFNETEPQISMAPFGIFESETQKCQRLDQYFRKDISNYYKTKLDETDLQVLHSVRDNDLIQLSDAMEKDLSQIWGDKIGSIVEIYSYLNLVLEIKKSDCRFRIVYDEWRRKKYCCFSRGDEEIVVEINDLEEKILYSRRQFLEQFEKYRENYKRPKKQKEIKELNFQIIFLYKILYDGAKSLNQSIIRIEENSQKFYQKGLEMEESLEAESNYTNFLMRKMIQNSLRDDDIDFLNFFRDNQILEHNNGPIQNRFTEQKQFQQFIKKKKNKKGRKAKYPLHSACLGCMSSYYQQYNPIYFCHECYVRFHKTCYPGFKEQLQQFGRQEKQNLCEGCYNKKMNINTKVRSNQCDYCNSRGVLHIPAGPNKRIHVFCMLINGLWKVNENRVQFCCNNQNKIPSNPDLKCTKCNSGSGYVNFCRNCEKIAHPLCAFLSGWRINVDFIEQNSNRVEIMMQCCGDVPLAQNERRRKFMTNFKRQAYSS